MIYDVVVIGSGPGGYVAAIRTSQSFSKVNYLMLCFYMANPVQVFYPVHFLWQMISYVLPLSLEKPVENARLVTELKS